MTFCVLFNKPVKCFYIFYDTATITIHCCRELAYSLMNLVNVKFTSCHEALTSRRYSLQPLQLYNTHTLLLFSSNVHCTEKNEILTYQILPLLSIITSIFRTATKVCLEKCHVSDANTATPQRVTTNRRLMHFLPRKRDRGRAIMQTVRLKKSPLFVSYGRLTITSR